VDDALIFLDQLYKLTFRKQLNTLFYGSETFQLSVNNYQQTVVLFLISFCKISSEKMLIITFSRKFGWCFILFYWQMQRKAGVFRIIDYIYLHLINKILMKKYILLSCFIWLFGYASAQNALTINNYQRFKRMVYAPGDGIYLQTKDKLHFGGRVDAVNDSFLTISKILEISDENGTKKIMQQDYVQLREIRAIYVHHIPHKWGIAKTGASTFLAAGAMFGVLGAWGYKFYNGATSNVKANLALSAGSFIASGLIKLASPNKRKIGNRWEMKVLPLYDGDLQTLKQ
jgi:hypothetical protein